MTYSVRNIAIAVVMAAVAAVLVLLYTSSYKDQVQEGQERVVVYVAARQIDAGTDASAAIGMLTPKEVLRVDATPGALSSTSGLEGKIAAQDIYPGQQVVNEQFKTEISQKAELQLEKSERGLRIRAKSTNGLLGAIRPGQRVDVYVAVKLANQTSWVVKRLAPNVRVLEAPDTAEDLKAKKLDDKEAVEEADVMVAVSQEAVSSFVLIAAAKQAGDDFTYWLAIRPPDGQVAPDVVTADSIESISSLLAPDAATRRKAQEDVAEALRRAIISPIYGADGDPNAPADGTDPTASTTTDPGATP